MINFGVDIKFFGSKFRDSKQIILQFVLNYVNIIKLGRSLECCL